MSGNNLKESKFYSGKIKSRLKSGNACCHSVRNLLSSSLLSKNITTEIHRIIIFPVFCTGEKHGCSY